MSREPMRGDPVWELYGGTDGTRTRQMLAHWGETGLVVVGAPRAKRRPGATRFTAADAQAGKEETQRFDARQLCVY